MHILTYALNNFCRPYERQSKELRNCTLYIIRVVIILFSTGLYKSAFSSYSFGKNRFSSFCVFVFYVSVSLVFIFYFFCSMFCIQCDLKRLTLECLIERGWNKRVEDRKFFKTL